MKLHANEIHIDEQLVRGLLASQFQQWVDLPLMQIKPAGTDNVIFNLGTEMCVRLPRIPNAASDIEKEQKWLPKLAPHLPFKIPAPLGKGTPSEHYPFHWSVYSWLEGKDALTAEISDFNQLAKDLAQFLKALQKVDTAGGPWAIHHNLRGTPLICKDAEAREAIVALKTMFDAKAVTAIWDESLQASDWNGELVWLHGDLLPGNILIHQGRLNAVIDFSGLSVGDPACDLMIAWNLLPTESRQIFRKELGVDDATWARGRGHALSQALIFIPYYLHTHLVGVEQAKKTVRNILADAKGVRE